MIPNSAKPLYKQNQIAQIENAASYERDAFGNPIYNIGKPRDVYDPKIASRVSYDTAGMVEPIGNYSEYIPNAALLSEDTNINALRADSQSGYQQMFNTAKRLIPNTILGTIGNLADILDFEDYANIDNEYGNPIEKATDSMMAWVNSKAPIYRKNPGESFNFSDSGYNWDNLSQLLNSVGSFALTGYITGGLMSAAADAVAGKTGIEALKLGANARAQKLLSAGKITESAIPKFIENSVAKRLYAAPTVLNAVALNQAESVMEAVPQYQQVYQMKMAQGMSDDDARDAASAAADVSVSINRLNVLSNLTSAGLFTGARGTITKLEGGIARSIGIESLQEGAEEGVNYIAQSESSLKGEQGDKFKHNLSRSLSHLVEPQGLESMMLGAIGGGGNTAITHYIVPAYKRVEGAVKDLKDAALLSGKKDVISKAETSIGQVDGIRDFMTSKDVDADPEAFGYDMAISSVAVDALNSEEGVGINLSGTQTKIAAFQNVLENRNSTPKEKERAQLAIEKLNSVVKFAKGEDLSGRENAKEILGYVIGINVLKDKIESTDKEIENQKSLEQNINFDGTLDEKLFNSKDNIKNLIALRSNLTTMMDEAKEAYKAAISEETRDALRSDRKKQAEEVKNQIDNAKATKNAADITPKTEPIVIETPIGEKQIYANEVVRTTPSVDNVNSVIPSIVTNSGNSVQEEYMHSKYVTSSEDGTQKVKDNIVKLTSVPQDKYEDITGSKFDKENPAVHLVKENGVNGNPDNFFTLFPTPDGKKFKIRHLTNATSELEAIVLVMKGAQELNNQLHMFQAVENPDTKVVIGENIIGKDIYDQVVAHVAEGGQLDMSSIIKTYSDKKEVEPTNKRPDRIVNRSPKEARELASKILDSEKKSTLMDTRKRLMAIAVNYLASKYSYVKNESTGEWLIKSNPDSVNQEFLKNSDFSFTNGAKITLRVVDGAVKSIQRGINGRPIVNEKDGSYATKDVSPSDAAKDNLTYGDNKKNEMPIGIFINDELVGYLPEHAWLEERNDARERTHIAPADNKEGETKIVQDIDSIDKLREEFKKQFNKGNKNFKVESKITNVGAGMIFSTEEKMPITESAPNLEEDVKKYTGSSGNMWGFMQGGVAQDVNGNPITNGIMFKAIDGTPVVMVPTANGMLSPQIAYASPLGEKWSASIGTALEMFYKNKGVKDILHDLGSKYRLRNGLNPETKSIDQLRRMGLYSYITTLLNSSKSKGWQFHMNFDENDKFVIEWKHAGSTKTIFEAVKPTNAEINMLTSDASSMLMNFSKKHLGLDNNGNTDNNVIMIHPDGTHTVEAETISDFYKNNRMIQFKVAGEIPFGNTTKGVYFVQPVLEFEIPNISVESKKPIVEVLTVVPIVTETVADNSNTSKKIEVIGSSNEVTITSGGFEITMDDDEEIENIHDICKK